MMPVFTALTALLQLAEAAIWQAGLVFLRVGATVALLPVAGEILLPMRLRLAIALALTAIVTPALPGAEAGGLAGSAGAAQFTLAAVATEVIAGLLLGLMLRFLFFALQIAGTIAAQSASLAQMFSGTGPEPQPVIASFLTLAGLALFCASDGVARAGELILLSYQLLPAGHLPAPADLATLSLLRVSRVFALGFTLAAPFVIAALLYNLTLGVINRAMPGLMVTFIGAPALSWAGILLLMLAAPFMLQFWHEGMSAALQDPWGMW